MFFRGCIEPTKEILVTQVYSCLVKHLFLFPQGPENFFDAAGNVIDLAGTDLISFDNIPSLLYSGYRGDPGGLPRKPRKK